MLLDPFMASLKSKTSSIDPYIKGEVWSLLSALEVLYTLSLSLDPQDPDPKSSDPGSEIRIQALGSGNLT